MSYNEFKSWCKSRIKDGYWRPCDAITCSEIVKEVNQRDEAEQEEYFQNHFDSDFIKSNIIERTNTMNMVLRKGS